MRGRIAEIHVIEPNEDGMATLYEVNVFISNDQDEGLVAQNKQVWAEVIGRTKQLIYEHQLNNYGYQA